MEVFHPVKKTSKPSGRLSSSTSIAIRGSTNSLGNSRYNAPINILVTKTSATTCSPLDDLFLRTMYC